MNHKLKIEIEDQNTENDIVTEILKNAGIGVHFVSSLAANGTKAKIDVRTSTKNIGLSESTVGILINNQVNRVSDLIHSFKSEFKDIKRLPKKNLDEINYFLMDNFNITESDFIPFCKLPNTTRRFFLQNDIFSFSQFDHITHEELIKMDGIKPSIICDVYLKFAELASPSHYATIINKEKSLQEDKKSVVLNNKEEQDFGGLTKIHGRTATKNLSLSDNCKLWLMENDFKTLFSILFEYESDFIKVRSNRSEDKLFLNKIIAEIKEYVFNISSIEIKSHSIIDLDLTKEAKTTLLKNKIYDIGKINEDALNNFIDDDNENEKELIIMETMEVLSQIGNMDIEKNIGKKNEKEHVEIKESEKSHSQEEESSGISERREPEGTTSKKLVLIPKNEEQDFFAPESKGEVETSNDIISLSAGMYSVECLDIPSDIKSALHDNGIHFVEDIYTNESKIFRAKGISKQHKQAIMDDISLFLSEEKAFEKKYLAHPISELKLPHSLNLALKKANIYYVELLLKLSPDELKMFDNIGEVSAEMIYNRFKLVQSECNTDFS